MSGQIESLISGRRGTGLSDQDLAFALSRRAMRASWDAIARMLEVPTDTVRRACDGRYTPAHRPAGALVAISRSDALRRRLKADGLPDDVVAPLVLIFNSEDRRVSVLDLCAAMRLPQSLGKKSLALHLKTFRTRAADAGYAVEATNVGHKFTTAGAAAIAARMAARVR